MKSKGFTLIETIVCIALIAVLALGISTVFISNAKMQRAGNVHNDTTMYYGAQGTVNDYTASNIGIGESVDINIANMPGDVTDKTLTIGIKYHKVTPEDGASSGGAPSDAEFVLIE